MDKLDQIVTDQLNALLFTPEKVRAILGGLRARQASRSEDHAKRLVGTPEQGRRVREQPVTALLNNRERRS